MARFDLGAHSSPRLLSSPLNGSNPKAPARRYGCAFIHRLRPSSARSMLLALMFTSAFGCGESRTQITLYVTGDGDLLGEVASLQLEFGPAGGGVLQDETLSPPTWPVTVALTPDSLDEFMVRITGRDASGIIISQALALTSFDPGHTRLYYVHLSRSACSPDQLDACADGTFCGVDGACVSPRLVPGSELPQHPAPDEDPDPCAVFTCGEGAECHVQDARAACRCVAPLVGDPSDACVDVCAGPASVDCGTNGVCVPSDDGVPECVCDFPFAGETCADCGLGWERVGDACEPVCAGGCEAHALCDDQIAVPECRCVSGYDRLGPDCVWVGQGVNGGGVTDHSFSDPTQWSLQASSLDPEFFGDGDGAVTFRSFGICGEAEAAQPIGMPAYTDAEPFAIVVNAVSNSGGGFEDCDATPALRLGDALQPLDFTSGTSISARVCAGLAAYGDELDFALVADANTAGACLSGSTACDPVTIDDVSFVVAEPDECPTPGVVTNGSFSMGSTAWEVSGGASAIAGGQLSLRYTNLCQTLRASTRLSFPDEATMPNAALTFSLGGAAAESVLVRLDRAAWVQLEPTTPAEEVRLCVPPWMRGTVRSLEFFASRSGLCATEITDHYDFDDFRFTSDPACADDVDGGFEDGEGWNILPSAGTISSRVLSSPSDAHSGERVYYFANSGTNSFSWSVGRLIQVPRADDGGVPMIRFWARNPASNPSYIVTHSAGGPDQFVPGSAWEQFTICPDPSLQGQELDFRLRFFRGDNVTNGQALYIDDVTVEVAAQCP